MPPTVGDTPPEFVAPLCDGETFRSTSLATAVADGAVVVFSGFVYSASARNWWKRYKRAGWDDFEVPVFGVTRDGPYAQNAFIRDMDVPFTFFSDVNGVACETFELLTPRAGMANVSTPTRAAFVIDTERTITYRWVAEDWVTPVPRREIEDAVAAM